MELQINEKLQGDDTYRGIGKTLEANTTELLEKLGYESAFVSVVLTNNEQIESLNREWRNEKKPTDVLSFPLHSPEQLHPDVWSLGDIVISLEYARNLVEEGSHDQRIADQLGLDNIDWSLQKEANFLMIHGLLHLIGYDHLEETQREEMKDKETELWRHLDI